MLAEGRRADLCVVDPVGLTSDLERTFEEPLEGFGGYTRLVRRSDEAVRAVVVGGRVASLGGQIDEAIGVERGFGRVLRASS